MITNEIVNEIRAKTDIVSIISAYLPLTKKGKNYFGVCPFHDDHSPSMSVSPDKQIYTCFSCGASGNVFNFVSSYEHITYYEAVKLLGERLGYNITTSPKEKKDDISYEIYDNACKFYQNNINTTLGKNAIEYLHSRQINDELINKFKIGLSMTKVSLTEYLLGSGYELNKLINIGLTNEQTKDIFLNRIMFPLFDLKGNVVAFSGRIYNTKDGSKYVNTKETNIFKKGTMLYNYHNAREHLKVNDTIIVMEGFMDVIRAYSIGVVSCVATMGTALTKQNALNLKKMATNIILCFDGDKAGEEATTKAIKIFEEIDVVPKVVRLEDNLDPDEYILSRGKESFLAKINNPISTLEFKMNIYKENKNFTDVEEISKYINEALKELSKLDDELLKELTIKKLEKEYGVGYDVLKKKLQSFEVIKPKDLPKAVIKPKSYGKYETAQRNLLYYMIKEKEVLEYVEEKLSYFPNDNLRFLANEIFTFYHKYGILVVADFITSLVNEEELYKIFQEIISMNLKEKYTKEEIDDYIYLINEYPKKNKINKLEEELRKEPDPIKKAQILSKIMEIKGVRK